MPPPLALCIRDVDVARPTDAEAAALSRLQAAQMAEAWPGDAVPDAAAVRRSLAASAAMHSYDVRTTLAWHDGDGVGQLVTSSSTKGDNPHLLQAELFVLPCARRAGVGSRLLDRALRRADVEGRTLLIGTSIDRAPAGAAFARRVGARPGLESLVYELAITRLDPDLLARWLRAGPERSPDIEVAWLSCPYPEHALEALAVVMRAMNDIPIGDLELGDRVVTPASLCDLDAARLARGEERWTLVARRRSDGALVGATETLWAAGRPAVVLQLGTVVLREARGRGLGRWLKAAMLERIVRERHAVRVVRTDNASMNAAMQAINDALGFRHVLTETVWQLDVSEARRDGA